MLPPGSLARNLSMVRASIYAPPIFTQGLRGGFFVRSNASMLEHFADERGGLLRAVGGHRGVVDASPKLLLDRGRDRFRCRRVVVHRPAGPIARETVTPAKALLEMMLERKENEWLARRREFHRRREAALHQRHVACREMPVQIRDERAHLDLPKRRERGGIDPRSRDDDHAQRRNAPLRGRPP